MIEHVVHDMGSNGRCAPQGRSTIGCVVEDDMGDGGWAPQRRSEAALPEFRCRAYKDFGATVGQHGQRKHCSRLEGTQK